MQNIFRKTWVKEVLLGVENVKDWNYLVAFRKNIQKIEPKSWKILASTESYSRWISSSFSLNQVETTTLGMF